MIAVPVNGIQQLNVCLRNNFTIKSQIMKLAWKIGLLIKKLYIRQVCLPLNAADEATCTSKYTQSTVMMRAVSTTPIKPNVPLNKGQDR